MTVLPEMMTHRKLRLVALCCDVIREEVEHLMPACPHEVDLRLLDRDDYHNYPQRSRSKLQAVVESVQDDGYDAILMGFALCNRLLDGVSSPRTPMVIVRAHDCLTLLMGSRQRYMQRFTDEPGTYYYSAGWLQGGAEAPVQSVALPGLESMTYEDLVERYGEDNAEYLMKVCGGWKANYRKGAFINLPFYASDAMRRQVQQECTANGWEYGEIDGDLSLLRRWLYGQWESDDILIVPPGAAIRATGDDRIICAGCVQEPAMEAAT